ncbi:hypothetical protein [Paenibacillus sp. NPDC057934]|uniref:hypothetical protein n=1 Tax=Paenibacillus sp. NPDC057934 TaxID=3346282 RepID=UPI0036DEBAC5
MKKKIVCSIVSISIMGSLVPSMIFASPSLQNDQVKTQVISTSESRIIKATAVSGSSFNSSVIAESNLLNPYISEGSDGLLHIDPAGKEIVSNETYQIVEHGISILNESLITGSTTISNGLVVAKSSSPAGGISIMSGFSNTYWWGVALTMNKSDASYFAYSLKQIAKGYAAEAAVATLLSAIFPNPATFSAAAAGAIVTAGCEMVGSSVEFHNGNTSNGVTLNVHWLPLPYYEVTMNSKKPY